MGTDGRETEFRACKYSRKPCKPYYFHVQQILWRSCRNKGVVEPVDEDLKAFALAVPGKVAEKMDKLRVADAMTEVFTLFKRLNKYIDETMPWALAKEEAKKDRLETVLYNLIESIKTGARLLESFMPETSEKILAQLGDGKVTEKPEILFARLDVEEVMKKVEELHPQMTAEEKENQADGEEETVIDIDAKPEITFDDFGKMQFQVGEIISCEAVPKSKKLLCYTGKNRKPGKTDCIRNPQTLYTRRNGRQESYGTCEPEACKAGGSTQ